MILLQSVHLFFACVALAFVEIQIEGPHGWAKNLPTWRLQPAWAKQGSLWFAFLRWVWKVFAGGNILTGYHFSLVSFLILIIFFPVTFAQDKVMAAKLCAAWFAIMTVVWDFLWFVFNKDYGLHRFKPQYIAWHPKWWGPAPSPYYGGILIGGALVYWATGDWRDVATALGVHATGVLLCLPFGLRKHVT